MLWSLHGGSEYLTHHHRETKTTSSLQFKPMSNSGITSCKMHHLLLSRQNLLSELFCPQERYPYPVSSPTAPLMVKSSFSSENHEESNQIVSCQCSRSLTTTAFPAHLLWQPSTGDYSFGSQHTKESFHCSIALCATKEDSLHWISTSFPALKSSSSEVKLASNRTDAKMKE